MFAETLGRVGGGGGVRKIMDGAGGGDRKIRGGDLADLIGDDVEKRLLIWVSPIPKNSSSSSDVDVSMSVLLLNKLYIYMFFYESNFFFYRFPILLPSESPSKDGSIHRAPSLICPSGNPPSLPSEVGLGSRCPPVGMGTRAMAVAGAPCCGPSAMAAGDAGSSVSGSRIVVLVVSPSKDGSMNRRTSVPLSAPVAPIRRKKTGNCPWPLGRIKFRNRL